MKEVVLLKKNEMPWVSWQIICVKFGYDPFKTNNVLLYIDHAIPQ